MIIGVYKILNTINNKVYIGQSIHIYKRWGYHKRQLKLGVHKNIHLQSAWNKYGEENFVFEVLEECEINLLSICEKEWCNYYNSHNTIYGYNKTIIEEGRKYKLTDDIKLKIGKFHKGKIISEEAKLKMSVTRLGRKFPQTTKDKMSESRKGLKHSEEAKNKMRGRRENFTQSDSWIKARKDRTRAIIQMDMNENFIAEFTSAKKAAAKNKLKSPGNISSCCRKNKNSYCNFKWKYKYEYV